MYTYSQLKKKIGLCAPFVPKVYASSGIVISKFIEGGSMNLATQVDFIYNGSRMHFRVINVFFYYYFFFFVLNIFFGGEGSV